MQISFSASGNPAQINAAINQQSKAARAAHPAHVAPVIGSVRDVIAADLAGVGAEEKVSVSASVSVVITKLKVAPAPAATDAPREVPAVEAKHEAAPAAQVAPKK